MLAGKALRNLRLYPPEHPLVRQEQRAFAEQLRAALRLAGGTLRLVVREGALLLDGLPAYEEPDLSQSLAHRLFVDGVRELALSEQLPPGGPERLLGLLHTLMSEPAQDAVALLEDQAPEGVLVEATSALAEAWEPPEFLSRSALERIEALNQEVDGLVAGLTAGQRERSELEYELTDGAQEARAAGGLGPTLEEDERGLDPFRLEEDELVSLRGELARWGPPELLLAVLEVCLGACADGQLGPDELGWVAREAQAQALGAKDLELLLRLALRLEAAREELPAAGPVLDERREWLAAPTTTRRLVDVVESGFLGGPPALVALLEQLGPAGGRALAGELFLRAAEVALEEALLGFLGQGLAEDPRGLLPLVAPEVPAAKARAFLFLLGKRGQGADVGPLLEAAARHPDPGLVEYAVHLRRSLTDEGRVEQALESLRSARRADRLLALQQLVEHKPPRALGALTEVIESDEFLTRDHEERLAFMLGVRVVGRDRAFGVLMRQRERKTWLLHRQAAREVREMAEDGIKTLRQELGRPL